MLQARNGADEVITKPSVRLDAGCPQPWLSTTGSPSQGEAQQSNAASGRQCCVGENGWSASARAVTGQTGHKRGGGILRACGRDHTRPHEWWPPQLLADVSRCRGMAVEARTSAVRWRRHPPPA